MAAVAREFRLLNGELVEHEGLAEAESIVEAQQLVAEALKLKAPEGSSAGTFASGGGFWADGWRRKGLVDES